MNEHISAPKAASLGLQHVLAMYAGAMFVPIIVGGAVGLNTTQLAYLIAIDLTTCGIATLLQMLVGDGLITGSLTAILLNFFLSFKISKKEKIDKVRETSLVSQGGN